MLGIITQSVLVLNASYQPLQITSVRRAVNLILADKAELIEDTGGVLRSPSRTFAVPLIIRLVRYIRLPRNIHVPLTRRTVMIRDQYACQYCRHAYPRDKLTIDHVVPKSRGGRRVWENVVTACTNCNRRKANRIPSEANMRLSRAPKAPRYIGLMWTIENPPPAWQKYLLPINRKKRR